MASSGMWSKTITAMRHSIQGHSLRRGPWMLVGNSTASSASSWGPGVTQRVRMHWLYPVLNSTDILQNDDTSAVVWASVGWDFKGSF